MKISIRIAETSDAPAICDAEKYWAAKPGYLVSRPYELKIETFARRIQELSQDPRGLYLVATNDKNEIIGHALLDPMGLSALSHIVRLTIVIHPGFEGKGVGVVLMDRLVQWSKETEGVEKIELLVRSSNARAISLYKKFGFKEEGRLVNRIKISDGNYLDDVSMGLMLLKT